MHTLLIYYGGIKLEDIVSSRQFNLLAYERGNLAGPDSFSLMSLMSSFPRAACSAVNVA